MTQDVPHSILISHSETINFSLTAADLQLDISLRLQTFLSEINR